MATVMKPPVRFRTFADALAALGDISPKRVRLDINPGRATVRDLLKLQSEDDRLYELVDGFLVEKVMGVPESDRALLHDWANRVIGYQDEDYAASDTLDTASATPMALQARAVRPQPDVQGRMPDPRTRDGLIDLYTYAHELAAYKRRHPGEDVMSMLLQAEDEGGKITTAEFENMFFLFAVAGNETTRNGIPGGMYCLLEHPDEYRRLLSDSTLLSSAVEEMLRYWPPVLHFRRTATHDSELSGQRIQAGQKVVVYHVSANRDPDVFPDPHRFDIGRSPNEHLSFGSGVHACLGASLARVQMRAIFSEILDQLGELEPAGPPAHLVSNFQQGLKRLPVRWKKEVATTGPL